MFWNKTKKLAICKHCGNVFEKKYGKKVEKFFGDEYWYCSEHAPKYDIIDKGCDDDDCDCWTSYYLRRVECDKNGKILK